MSALSSPSAAFLALCAQHGVDPNAIPDAIAPSGRKIVGGYKPRQRPRSPDRKASRDRRRRLGGSSALPDTLRHNYTEGQRAVLTIVAGEVKHHGVCNLPLDKIAALAGVGRTTVQTTMHLAWKGLAHIKITRRPRRNQKSLTNVVEITSTEWLTWIKRGPSAHKPNRVQNSKIVNPTKNITIDDDGQSTKVIEPSVRAVRLATELASIAGHDPKHLPPLWERQQPALIVEGWILNYAGVSVPVTMASQQILKLAQYVMSRKPEKCPPNSIKYFGPVIDREVDQLNKLMRGRGRQFSAARGDRRGAHRARLDLIGDSGR